MTDKVRITARLPDDIISDIEKAASIIGVTVNAYVVMIAHESATKLINEFEMSWIK